MKRVGIGILVLLAAGCSDSPEDFPMEIRCAEQAYDSARRGSLFGKTMYIAETVVWLRKSAGLPLNTISVPEAAKAEMYRLDWITRPPEMPLPCTLSEAEQKIVTDMMVTLALAADGEELRADEMLDAVTN